MRITGALIPEYQEMHRRGRYSRGSTLRKHLDRIAAIVAEIPTRTILDYGCGSERPYVEDRLHDAWGGIMPTLFDPGVPGLDDLPEGTFDGVICTGVLEHIPRKRGELADAIGRIADYADRWAFISIGCVRAHKTLPNGLNAHVTLRPEEWWHEQLAKASWRARLHVDFIWS
jgi:hypothetical protein